MSISACSKGGRLKAERPSFLSVYAKWISLPALKHSITHLYKISLATTGASPAKGLYHFEMPIYFALQKPNLMACLLDAS